jgi:hypothetical protein
MTGRACTPVSSINKTDRHDITEILLKVALNTINLTKPISTLNYVSGTRLQIFGKQKHLIRNIEKQNTTGAYFGLRYQFMPSHDATDKHQGDSAALRRWWNGICRVLSSNSGLAY